MVSISRSAMGRDVLRVALAFVGLLLATGISAGSGMELQSAGERLLVDLPSWLVVLLAVVMGLAALFILFLIAPKPRLRRKKGEEPFELHVEPVKRTPGAILLLSFLALTPLAGSIFLLWYGLAAYRHLPIGETLRNIGEAASAIPEAPTSGIPLPHVHVQ